MSLEKNKQLMRQMCQYRCVICMVRNPSIEVHHLKPIETGGSDELENLVALCPSCHREYQDNRRKDTRIREMRDWWIDRCTEKQENEDSIAELIEAKIKETAASTDAKLDGIKLLLLGHEKAKIDEISRATSVPQAIVASGIDMGTSTGYVFTSKSPVCQNCGAPILQYEGAGVFFCPRCGNEIQ